MHREIRRGEEGNYEGSSTDRRRRGVAMRKEACNARTL